LDEHNPYEPPKTAMGPTAPLEQANRRVQMWTFGTWIFVFAINMAVPLLFSSSMTEEHGKLGMAIALLASVACGCFLCAYHRELALALIIGGVLVGLTQLFPILQFLAGIIGTAVGQALGLAEFGNDERGPRVTSELGGFVVTLVTGGILITAAALLGMAIRSLIARNRKRRSRPPEAPFLEKIKDLTFYR
jgi:MFS family permease